MKNALLGLIVLLSACLAHGGGDALYKQGAAVYKSDPSQAFGLFVQAAEAGNPSAMAGAGHCYETGTGASVDYAKAIEWYEKAVTHNSLKACEGLARIYASCDDPEFHNGAKAVKYAAVIARKKPRDAEALSLLAAAHARNIEFDKAEKTQRTAQRNASRDLLGECNKRMAKYANGEPHPPKATEAWMLRAAEIDSGWAVERVARLAADQSSSLYNPELAIKMCQKRIDAGNVEMYVLMGNLHLGEGELDRAFVCYQKAYDNKHRPDGWVIPLEVSLRSYLEDPVDRVTLRAKQCKDGYEKTESYQFQTGTTTESVWNGWTYTTREVPKYETRKRVVKVPPSCDSAYFLYKIAVKKGSANAEAYLEAMEREMNAYKRILDNEKGLDDRAVANALRSEAIKFEENKVVPRDLELVATLYEKSYELSPSAKTAYDLGLRYLRSSYGQQTQKAIVWLEIAHSKGVEGANRKLIDLYACGIEPSMWNGEKAVEYATVLVEGNETDHDAHQLLACAYARDGQFMNAGKAMDKALGLLRESAKKSGRLKTRYEQQYHSFKRGEPWPPEKD